MNRGTKIHPISSITISSGINMWYITCLLSSLLWCYTTSTGEHVPTVCRNEVPPTWTSEDFLCTSASIYRHAVTFQTTSFFISICVRTSTLANRNVLIWSRNKYQVRGEFQSITWYFNFHEDSSGLSSISELLIMCVGVMVPYHYCLDRRLLGRTCLGASLSYTVPLLYADSWCQVNCRLNGF